MLNSTLLNSGFPEDAHGQAAQEKYQKLSPRLSKKFAYEVGIGDETWIYYYEHETRQKWAVWVFQNEQDLEKVLRVHKTSKKMISSFLPY